MAPRSFCLFFSLLLFVHGPAAFSDEGPWDSAESRHFTVYFQREGGVGEAGRVLAEAELVRKRLRRKWKPFSPWAFWRHEKRCHIYLYPTKEDFLAATRRPSWSRSAAMDADEKIIALSRDSPTILDAELPHEIAHIYFRQWLGGSGPLPLWIDEGVALTEEAAPRDPLGEILSVRIRERRVIPFKSLLRFTRMEGLDRDGIILFYSQSRSLVKYLVGQFGHERFLRFSRLLVNGSPFQQAWADAFDLPFGGLEALQNQWLTHSQT
jgi:hypothetical protein